MFLEGKSICLWLRHNKKGESDGHLIWKLPDSYWDVLEKCRILDSHQSSCRNNETKFFGSATNCSKIWAQGPQHTPKYRYGYDFCARYGKSISVRTSHFSESNFWYQSVTVTFMHYVLKFNPSASSSSSDFWKLPVPLPKASDFNPYLYP